MSNHYESFLFIYFQYLKVFKYLHWYKPPLRRLAEEEKQKQLQEPELKMIECPDPNEEELNETQIILMG